MSKSYDIDVLLDEITGLKAQLKKKDSIIADLHAKLNTTYITNPKTPNTTKKAPPSTVPLEQMEQLLKICQTLELFTTCDEGLNYLKSKHLTRKELNQIAKHYHITRKSDAGLSLEERIVQAVVGTKVRLNTLLNTDCIKV